MYQEILCCFDNNSLPASLSSADNLCKQFGLRSEWTECHSWSGSKPFDTLIVLLKECFEKDNFEKSRQATKYHENLPSMQRVIDTYNRKLHIPLW